MSGCTVCSRDDVGALDIRVLKGEAVRSICRSTGISKSSMLRHINHGTVEAKATAIVRRELLEAPRKEVTVLEKARALTKAGEMAALCAATEGKLDHVKLLDLEARLSGELVTKTAATTTVVNAGPRSAREAVELMKSLMPALERQAEEDERNGQG